MPDIEKVLPCEAKLRCHELFPLGIERDKDGVGIRERQRVLERFVNSANP